MEVYLSQCCFCLCSRNAWWGPWRRAFCWRSACVTQTGSLRNSMSLSNLCFTRLHIRAFGLLVFTSNNTMTSNNKVLSAVQWKGHKVKLSLRWMFGCPASNGGRGGGGRGECWVSVWQEKLYDLQVTLEVGHHCRTHWIENDTIQFTFQEIWTSRHDVWIKATKGWTSK